MGKLDEEKIATLRRWAEGLARDERDELRAAARAILLLIDEVDELHVELWHARGLRDTEEVDEAAEPGGRPSLPAILKGRLRNAPASSPPD